MGHMLRRMDALPLPRFDLGGGIFNLLGAKFNEHSACDVHAANASWLL